MKWKAPNNVASVFFDREARENKWSGNIVRRLPLHDRPWSLKFVTLLGAIHFTIVLNLPRDSGETFCTALWDFEWPYPYEDEYNKNKMAK